MSPRTPPHLQRYSAPMTGIFYFFAFLSFASVYFAIYHFLWRFASYPIELEWREGTAWIHALAQSSGINIFEDGRVAYVNANHGIVDLIVKAAILRAFPFLEPQYILRSFVLLFPAISFLSTFVHCRRYLRGAVAFITALGLNSAMLILLHDIGHWNTCIGRSDSTAYTLMAVAYLCYHTDVSTRWNRLARHISYLSIALVLSTNWRIYPIALVIPVLVEQCSDSARIRDFIKTYLSIAGYTLAVCAFFLVTWFHSDVSRYYRYFFGFFSGNSPWPPSSAPFQTMIQYVRTPAIACLILLSIAPLLVETWKCRGKRTGRLPKIFAAVAIFASFVVSIVALKMNFGAAGYWYLSPQVIVLIIYYGNRHKIGPVAAAIVLTLSLCVLWQSNNSPLIKWQYRQLAETLPDARKYTAELILLDRAFGVYSEEAHLFKRSGNLPPIDMGDAVEAFAKANYFGPRFTAAFAEQRAKILSHEPVLVFVGGCASTAVKQLAEDEEYCLFMKSPTLWIGGAVYVKKDHIEDVQRFLMSHAQNLQ